MNPSRTLAAAGLALLIALGGAQAGKLPPRTDAVSIDDDGSDGAGAVAAACNQMMFALQSRGWTFEPLRVHVRRNALDATAPAADLVLSAAEAPDDGAFALAETVVTRVLAAGGADVETARTLARTVAAHLSPPGSPARMRWEQTWATALYAGDLWGTAVPELLWRSGADAAIRGAAEQPWTEAALATAQRYGVTDVERAVGEVVLAGVFRPESLGFHVPPAELDLIPKVGRAGVELTHPGVKLVALPRDAKAFAVSSLRSEHVNSWLAVRYALTGDFDVVPLAAGREVAVPVAGAAWAGVVSTSLAGDGFVSLALRPLSDYPVRLDGWDFVAGESGVSLMWETSHHDGLRAYVVESLVRDGQKWIAQSRQMIPVGDEGDHSFNYSFADETRPEIRAYRLLALTSDGLLAEIGVFPTATEP